MRYYRSGNWLWAFSTVWGLLVPAVLVLTGFSARMRDVAKRVSERWVLTLFVYFVMYTLLTFVIDLPLQYYEGFVRPHAYGLSDQAFAKWMTDMLKTLGLGLVGGLLFIWIPFLLLRKSPERWWIWTSLVAVPLVVVMIMVVPVYISPLFNEFGPMKDTVLEGEILALADRAGIEGGRVYEVEKSVDTNTVNAYVTGLGSTKRIVLWDTIIAKLDQRQLLVVMGHEMGHFVLGHVTNFVIAAAIGIPAFLFGAHVISKRLIARFRDRIGFAALSDPAAIPLISLVLGVLGFIVSPAFNGLSRYQEHESDRFALEITHDNYACATAFASLQNENLANPRPGLLFKLWRASHPPIGERIDFCNDYRPWERGETEKYAHLFEE
jgi:Zn-dependent protease with chaperone function